MVSIGLFGSALATAFTGALIYANLPTRLTIGALVPTVDYLAGSKLILLEPGKEASSAVLTGKEVQVILLYRTKSKCFTSLSQASDLFQSAPTLVMAIRRPGCAFCRKEAAKLCSIVTKSGNKNVRVIGIVHETVGVDQFRPFLGCADAIYLDNEVLHLIISINSIWNL
jgi:hypothetical protein